jgi:curved DNA-binding protein CbpA
MDLYGILGISRDATSAEIKRAYHQAAKRTHPDAGGSDEDFRNVELAYRVLSDPDARKRYDETGRADDQADNTHARVLGFLSELLTEVLAREDAKTVDIVGLMRLRIEENRREAAQHVARARKDELRILDVRKRLRAKNSSGEFAFGIIDAQVSGIRAQIERIEQATELLDRAKAMLEALEYMPDTFPAPHSVPWSQSASAFFHNPGA